MEKSNKEKLLNVSMTTVKMSLKMQKKGEKTKYSIRALMYRKVFIQSSLQYRNSTFLHSVCHRTPLPSQTSAGEVSSHVSLVLLTVSIC